VANSVTGSSKGLGNVTPDKKLWLAIVCALLGLLLLVALIEYDPDCLHRDPPVDKTLLLNKGGLWVADFLFAIFGIAAWLLPWLLGTISFLFATRPSSQEKIRKVVTIFAIIVSISVLASVRHYDLNPEQRDDAFDPNMYRHGAGGSIGAFFYSGMPWDQNRGWVQGLSEDQNWKETPSDDNGFFREWMGALGTSVLMAFLLLASLCMHFSMEPLKLIRAMAGLSKKVTEQLPKKTPSKDPVDSNLEASPKEKKVEDTKILEESISSEEKESKNWKFPWSGKEQADDLLFGDVSLQNDGTTTTQPESSPVKKAKESAAKPKAKKEVKDEAVAEEPATAESSQEEEVLSKHEEPDEKPDQDPVSHVDEDGGMDGFKVVRPAKTEKAADLFPERKGDYHFPTPDLLMEPPEVESSGDEDHMIKAKRLKETLSEFKIEVEMGEVHTGPVITRYDVHPAPGVKVEKIANLDKNLAMALKADSVRILAPVPGKGCVGIEVPNANPSDVCLKEILESKAWADAGAEIPIVLGKDASGRPLVADLTKMPHLLVAGSTGSGKTVCINAIIASLCYHSSPDDVRFIMVDPKIVEMKVYNDLPHMLIPVVTDPKKVPGALKWLLIEMERRYQIFSKVGVRNIAGFNAKILKDKEEKEKAQLLDAQMTPEERAALSNIEVPRDDHVLEIPENKLPYIVCIIDELADLMMVAQADVETGIARLAQLARAAGIHLVIATQRPSVNVITGVIKANLPSRISFRVASYRDSQTILDGKGAESLLGKGDMLFIPPGGSTFIRAQGAFVSDDEINGIVEFLKINGPPQIIEEVRDQIEAAGEDEVLGGGDGDPNEDPMIRKSIEIIRTTKRASTSNLQRKLSIGYNRAARIMDELEDRGVVGPDIPGQGREILLDL
jgi:S-DNA-T family DNA segregation ATPase FtsK/SpoIIIE